jgi:hypothetical protein
LAEWRAGNEAVLAIARSPQSVNLTSLILRARRVTDAAVMEMTRSRYLTNLQALDVRHNDLSKAAKTMLRDRFPFIRLK